MHDVEETYEQLKAFVGSLDPAPSSLGRHIGYADDDHSIALSRNEAGRIEIFLLAARLSPSHPVVDRALDYRDDWQSSNEGSLSANQVVLPGDAYFDSAAAMICVELIHAGFHEDPQGAFAQVEPLMARFIEGGGQIGDQVLVGLFGELLLLDALTANCDSSSIDDMIASWFGWRPSSRDFQLDSVGIEVKTTSTSTSRHHIQGFHQVEVGHPVTDVAETSLRLLSLGVAAIPSGLQAGQTVPALVQRIADRASMDTRTDFLDRVQAYGGDAGLGYKHARDHSKARFQKRFALNFERLYDLTDDSLRILRRDDVVGFPHIDVDSIEFDVDLPYPFRGVINPVTGLQKLVDALLM